MSLVTRNGTSLLTRNGIVFLLRTHNSSGYRDRDIAKLQRFLRVNVNAFIPYLICPFPHTIQIHSKLKIQQRLRPPCSHFTVDGRMFFRMSILSNGGVNRHFQVQLAPSTLDPPVARNQSLFSHVQVAIRPQELPSAIPLQMAPLKTYFDEEFRTHYFIPPSMLELGRFVEIFQVEGEYCGISYGRKMKLKNLKKPTHPIERCDAIALTKNPSQVKYESRSTATGFMAFIDNIASSKKKKKVEKLRIKQMAAFEQIQVQLKEKIKEWNYDDFMIADEKMLLELGYSAKAAKELHLLALFYKRVPMQR